MKTLFFLPIILVFFTCTMPAADNQIQTPDQLTLQAIYEGNYEKFSEIVGLHQLGQHVKNLAFSALFDFKEWKEYVGADKEYNYWRQAAPFSDDMRYLDFSQTLNEEGFHRAKIAILALQLGANPQASSANSCAHVSARILNDCWMYPPKIKVGFYCRREIFLCKPYISVLYALRDHKFFVHDAHPDDADKEKFFTENAYLYNVFDTYSKGLLFENSSHLHPLERKSEKLRTRVIEHAESSNQDYREFLKHVLRIRKSTHKPSFMESGQLLSLFDELQAEILLEPYCALAYLLAPCDSIKNVCGAKNPTHTDLPKALPMILHAAQKKK